MTEIMTREQIPAAHQWDLAAMFSSDEAWAAAFKTAAETLAPSIAAYKDHLAEGEAVLLACFTAIEQAFVKVGSIFIYAALAQAGDTTNQKANGMYGQAAGLFSQVAAASAFLDPELIAIGESTVRGWVSNKPELAIYGQYVDDLFRKQAHVRSAEIEEVLGLFGDMFNQVGNTAQLLVDADLKFAPARNAGGQPVELAQGTKDTLISSPDREVRRTAWENYCDSYLAVKNTLASNLLVNVKREITIAQIRKHPSALEASVFANNIPPTVFNNLIETFKKNLPTWHRYWRIRRRALGVPTLAHYDIWAPIVSQQPVVPYEQAVAMICEGLAPLGPEYVATARHGMLDARWVDRYPTKGKSQGAFSSGMQGTHPYILMSYDDQIGSLSTLAHELGHSMHSYLTWQNQPFVYSNYSIFAAEVASNFNQAMVRAHLLRTNSDKQFQLAVLEEGFENFHRYFFIMPTLARFEQTIHSRVESGQPVTADDMNSLMTDLFSEGYGGEMEVDAEREGITWAQFLHLYNNFYVYQYATGISGAHAFLDQITRGVPGAVERYLGFLKAGSSKYPLHAIRDAGVDLESPETVEKIFGFLGEMVDRFDALTQ
jgi:oligoendopeptidase F